MIQGFRHKGLERFFKRGSKAGIRPEHAARLRDNLARLDDAERLQDVNAPGYRLHPLSGDRSGRWAVTVSGNWRLTFNFSGGNAHDVDYLDYH